MLSDKLACVLRPERTHYNPYHGVLTCGQKSFQIDPLLKNRDQFDRDIDALFLKKAPFLTKTFYNNPSLSLIFKNVVFFGGVLAVAAGIALASPLTIALGTATVGLAILGLLKPSYLALLTSFLSPVYKSQESLFLGPLSKEDTIKMLDLVGRSIDFPKIDRKNDYRELIASFHQNYIIEQRHK